MDNKVMITDKNELSKRIYLALCFQINECITLQDSFTLGNHLFKTNIIIREIIKENDHLKAFKEIYGSAKYNKNYQKFLNNKIKKGA